MSIVTYSIINTVPKSILLCCIVLLRIPSNDFQPISCLASATGAEKLLFYISSIDSRALLLLFQPEMENVKCVMFVRAARDQAIISRNRLPATCQSFGEFGGWGASQSGKKRSLTWQHPVMKDVGFVECFVLHHALLVLVKFTILKYWQSTQLSRILDCNWPSPNEQMFKFLTKL